MQLRASWHWKRCVKAYWPVRLQTHDINGTMIACLRAISVWISAWHVEVGPTLAMHMRVGSFKQVLYCFQLAPHLDPRHNNK
jgi:hypothetical protein